MNLRKEFNNEVRRKEIEWNLMQYLNKAGYTSRKHWDEFLCIEIRSSLFELSAQRAVYFLFFFLIQLFYSTWKRMLKHLTAVIWAIQY